MAVVLGIALVLGYLVWLTPQLFRRLDRYQALLEQRAIRPEADKHAEPMPVDLIMQVRQAYSEKWAQDQAIEALMDTRARVDSWDDVRATVAAGGV